jgi:hypothetical protein
MRDFLLKKDLWTLDLVSSVLFGLGFSYLQRTVGRIINEITLDRILFGMLLALVSYLATFVVALFLRKRLQFLRSWMWMGIVGTLVFLVISQLVYFYPRNWEYFKLTSDTTSMAVQNALLDTSVSTLIGWIILTPFACVCIFAMRFIAYFIAGRNQVEELE